MQVQRVHDRLQCEFRMRREKNSHYSLRAFAAFLGTDHSTLSQIRKGSRRVPLMHIRAWGRKLGFAGEEVSVYVAAEHIPDAPIASDMRRWCTGPQKLRAL
jgi:transcriptional regulator with XRE-family HTH domain